MRLGLHALGHLQRVDMLDDADAIALAVLDISDRADMLDQIGRRMDAAAMGLGAASTAFMSPTLIVQI